VELKRDALHTLLEALHLRCVGCSEGEHVDNFARAKRTELARRNALWRVLLQLGYETACSARLSCDLLMRPVLRRRRLVLWCLQRYRVQGTPLHLYSTACVFGTLL